MKPAALRKVVSRANWSSEWLVMLGLLAASIPPVLIRQRSLTSVPQINLLDGSWLLDLGYKASGGIWLGRDVAFTYGPLFQWLSSAPARYLGISMGTVEATWYTLPLLLIVVATFLSARLLLGEAAAWKRALFVLLAVVFWSPPDLRISLVLLAFVYFLHVAGAVSSGNAMAWRGLAAAAVCVGGFWMSVDTGLYCTATLVLCLVATAMVDASSSRRIMKFTLIAAGFFAALVLLTNFVLFSVFDLQFWRSSLAIAAGYRWFEPSAMAKPDKRILLASLLLTLAVFGAAWYRRKADGRLTRSPAFLLAGICLAILILQSALVRSDHVHVMLGIYPLLFFSGAIAMGESETRRLSVLVPAVVVIATVALASAYPLYTPGNLKHRCGRVLHPLRTCPADMREFDRACFSPAGADLLTNVSAYVRSQTHPGDHVAVFPYQTMFGLASRHQVAGGVLQNYLAGGDYLTALDLAGLRSSRPPFALYFPDGPISEAIDGIPNFTRSPEIWFYLLEHYRSIASPAPGVRGLARDDGRAERLRLSLRRIAGPVALLQIRKRNGSIAIDLPNGPVYGADFLRLRLKANYPLWWRLRKPSKLALEISFADGTTKLVEFVLQPGLTSDVWIYPWNAEMMDRYFSDDSGDWRSGRPPLTDLKILVNPYDWISVAPDSIIIDAVEAVTVELR